MKTETLLALLFGTTAVLSSGCIGHVTATVLDINGKPFPAGTKGTFTVSLQRGTGVDDRNFTVTSGADKAFHFDFPVEGAFDLPTGGTAHFTLSSDESRPFGCAKESEAHISKYEYAVTGGCKEAAVSQPLSTSARFRKDLPALVVPPAEDPKDGAAQALPKN